MPRRQMIEVQCERCPKLWYEEVNQSPTKVESGLQLVFDTGTEEGIIEVKYDVLCANCRSACLNYVNQVRKRRVVAETLEQPDTPGTEG